MLIYRRLVSIRLRLTISGSIIGNAEDHSPERRELLNIQTH